MPAVPAPRQPEHRLCEWFRNPAGRGLLARIQRESVPELTRVFGSTGLYLRPIPEVSVELSGNMLARVVSLYRAEGGFSGQLRCDDGELPIASHSLSLVYALFVLETSPQPTALVEEIARCLKPEGMALVLSLNPWSLSRWRWFGRDVRHLGVARLDRLAHEAGLDVVRRKPVGPIWLGGEGGEENDARDGGWFGGLRSARLSVWRRRESPLTPLRKPAAVVSLRPGVTTGAMRS